MITRITLTALLFAAVSLPPAVRSPAAETAPSSYQTATNILYRSGMDLDEYARERCRLDVYHPSSATNFPTVVWFHGGGLTGGNRSVPEALKEKGVAVVAVNYRLSPKVKSPQL